MANKNEYRHPSDVVVDALVAQAKMVADLMGCIAKYEEPLEEADLRNIKMLSEINDATVTLMLRLVDADVIKSA